MGHSGAKIAEAGAAVWAAGKIVPGVSGVLSAAADVAAGTVVVVVGSGSYNFAVLVS
jgi:hypothetical protein